MPCLNTNLKLEKALLAKLLKAKCIKLNTMKRTLNKRLIKNIRILLLGLLGLLIINRQLLKYEKKIMILIGRSFVMIKLH